MKLGDPVPGDPLFRFAELPAGWRKLATRHAMWSELVDDKGRVRARIFIHVHEGRSRWFELKRD